MTGGNFSVVFNSDIYSVKHVVNEALEYLCECFSCLTNEMFFDFKILMSELLLNAVVHGNSGDISKKTTLNIKIVGTDSVLIQVIDEGAGFDFSSMLDKALNDETLMDESGRGIKIINSIADEISYGKHSNDIKIYKKVVAHGK